jgi:hypothetical protein
MTSTPNENGYPVHPFAEIFPLHDGQPLWDLRDDIAANGLHDPIVLYNGQVLDGRRRQACCIARGVTPHYTQFNGDDEAALKYVVSKNLKRRHLGEAERAMVAAKVANLTRGRPLIIPPIGGIINGQSESANSRDKPATREKAARMLNVSPRSVDRAKVVTENGTPALQDAVKDGTVSLHDAAKVAAEPPEVQDEAVKQVKDGKVRTAAAAVEDAKPPPGDAEEPQSLLDKNGEPWPVRALPAVAMIPEYERLIREFAKFIKAIEAMKNTPIGVHLDSNGICDHLRRAADSMKARRMYCGCPYCDGGGFKDGAICKTCRGSCWVAKTTWDNSPKANGFK